MPPIWDPAYRPGFYARWGRENCIIAARTRAADYPPYRQTLSIKAAWGGREDYYVDGRRVAVDDDTFMILNEGRTYGSRLRSLTPVTSFSIFFRPGMARDVARTLAASHEHLLEDPDPGTAPVEFAEHVHRHDRSITPVLRYIRAQVQAGEQDEHWYEDQLYFLLRRMMVLRERDRQAALSIRAVRAGTRRELYRRTGLALDYINTNFARPIGLAQIAAAARLSPYHCLRVFKSVCRQTPAEHLREKRLQVARRALNDASLSIEQIAATAGFQSRTTLFRSMKRSAGVSPAKLRRQWERTPLEMRKTRPDR